MYTEFREYEASQVKVFRDELTQVELEIRALNAQIGANFVIQDLFGNQFFVCNYTTDQFVLVQFSEQLLLSCDSQKISCLLLNNDALEKMY